MLKRTKGRLLLTLLVITGLAGTLNDTAISSKERKASVTLLKETKAELLKTAKDLSEAQLNYKVAPDQLTIKECIYNIALLENQFSDLLKTTMKSPTNPEHRSLIQNGDEAYTSLPVDFNAHMTIDRTAKKGIAPYKSVNDALSDFKQQRVTHIKYVKTTTEDLRNHVAQTQSGWADCYQLTLMMGIQTRKYHNEIREIMSHPGFPKQ